MAKTGKAARVARGAVAGFWAFSAGLGMYCGRHMSYETMIFTFGLCTGLALGLTVAIVLVQIGRKPSPAPAFPEGFMFVPGEARVQGAANGPPQE